MNNFRRCCGLGVVLLTALVLVGPIQSEYYNNSICLSSFDDLEVDTILSLKNGENLPPTANFSWTPSDPKEGELISFKDASVDPDDNIVTWLWDFGDGATSNDRDPRHAYGHAGTYDVTLNVTDSGGPGYAGRLLTSDANQQNLPRIFGDLVVWNEISTEHGVRHSTVYLYNVSSDVKTQIAPSPNDQSHPRIYGKLIVWLEDVADSGLEIFAYDVESNESTLIRSAPVLDDVDVYGDRIVWREISGGTGWDIYVFNCTTQNITEIPSPPSATRKIRPRIFGDYIVWEDDRYGNWNYDIYMYDLLNKSETQITSEPSIEYGVEIWGHRVVWMDTTHGWTDIFMYDILSGETTQITSGDMYDLWPDIWEDRVIWGRELEGKDGGMFMFDISENKTSQLAQRSAIQQFPSLYRNRVVWEQFEVGNQSGNHDIYFLEIKDTGSQPLSDKKTVRLKVENVAPIVKVWGIYENQTHQDFLKANEGSPIMFGGSFEDPSWLDSHVVLWDFGDGETQSGTVASTINGTHHILKETSHTYGDDGEYTVELQVVDDLGEPGSDFIEVDVENVSPTVQVNAPVLAREGSSVTFDAVASDPGSDDLRFQWNWGDGTPDTVTEHFNNGIGPDPYPSPGGSYPVKVTTSAVHTYGDNAPYKVTLTIDDDDGGQVVYSTTLAVDNVAPLVKPFGLFTVHENEPITVEVEAEDPGSDDLTFIWEFEFGPTFQNVYYNDGMGPDPYPSPNGTHPFFATDMASHTYGDDGYFHVTVVVVDDDGGETSYTTTITVYNVDPVSSIEAYAFADLTLRIAGEKWHNVEMIVYEDGVGIGHTELVRYPGSPDDQNATLTDVRYAMNKELSATVLYTPDDDPVNGQPTGANPAWIILWFEDGSSTTLNHTFNVNHPETWTWSVSINQLFIGHNISFEATAYDPGSDDLTFVWRWGDGSQHSVATYYNNKIGPDPHPSPEINPITITDVQRHIFMTGGSYTIRLTVGDDDGGNVERILVLSL
jgi:beta propeller repeat protein